MAIFASFPSLKTLYYTSIHCFTLINVLELTISKILAVQKYSALTLISSPSWKNVKMFERWILFYDLLTFYFYLRQKYMKVYCLKYLSCTARFSNVNAFILTIDVYRYWQMNKLILLSSFWTTVWAYSRLQTHSFKMRAFTNEANFILLCNILFCKMWISIFFTALSCHLPPPSIISIANSPPNVHNFVLVKGVEGHSIFKLWFSLLKISQ